MVKVETKVWHGVHRKKCKVAGLKRKEENSEGRERDAFEGKSLGLRLHFLRSHLHFLLSYDLFDGRKACPS